VLRGGEQTGQRNQNRGNIMDVACEKCQGKFTIPDEKVPKGQAFSLTCPKCNNKILFDAQPQPDSDDKMGYNTTAPESPKDVLKQMRFHVFDVVVINERFGTPNPDMNNILKYLERLGMSTRRDIFVVLVTDRFRTMDNMMEFNKSVNLIVNLKNIDEIEKILIKGVADNVAFYRVFKESLTKTGRV
jgi:ribosomal protein S27E